MSPSELSSWYAEKFDKPERDYASEEFKLDLSTLTDVQRKELFNKLQPYLSQITYYKDGQQIEVNASNQDSITVNFYFNTMTIPNVEMLKALHGVIGE